MYRLRRSGVIYLYSYVYWTVHHFDSWIKRDQLDVTCFFISLFNAQHVSDVNTSILRSLRLIYWVISWAVLLWFDVCWCYVVVLAGVMWYPYAGWSLHTDTTSPQACKWIALLFTQFNYITRMYLKDNVKCKDSLLLINRRNGAKLPKFTFRSTFPVIKRGVKILWDIVIPHS